MQDFSVFGNGGMETSIPIGDVFNNSDRTVGFNQTVLTFNDITIAFFLLFVVISGVVIVYAVGISVTWMLILRIDRKKKVISIAEFQ